MFENIHFQYVNFESPSKKNTSEIYLKKYRMTDISQESRLFYENQKEDVDFSIEGEGKTVFPRPLSASAKNNLLYLQVFGLTTAGSNFYTRRKNYDSYLLLYTYQGEGILEYDGKEYNLTSGSLCFIDCRKPHFYCTTEGAWIHAVLHFNGHGAEYLYSQFYQDHNAVLHTERSHQLQNNLENVLRSCQGISRFYELETSHSLETLILRILEEKYRDGQNVPDYILYLRKYIEHNFTQPLSLETLSAFANISKYHLDREFKKYVGFSIHEYLIELRIDRARFLLSTTEFTIAQISRTCGFLNYSNFYKLFIKSMQMTPMEFRKTVGSK